MKIDDVTIGMEINNDTLCEILNAPLKGYASLKAYQYACFDFKSGDINLYR